jgi:hypothetical protein
MYTVPFFLIFIPRSAGGPSAFGGRAVSDVITLKLKNSDDDFAGRSIRYLWQDEDIVVLQDKSSDELLLIERDEVRLMILTAPGVEYDTKKPSNREIKSSY